MMSLTHISPLTFLKYRPHKNYMKRIIYFKRPWTFLARHIKKEEETKQYRGIKVGVQYVS
ncbi:hypothetical protein BC941DRAFT_434092 [Chlamydoabsidia padenii]|nr:hypothetical protein BC941DRAFT_434092 [Chlamydoabsidia padenii]